MQEKVCMYKVKQCKIVIVEPYLVCNTWTNLIVLSAANQNIVLSDPFTMFKSISVECLQNPSEPGGQVQSLQFVF